MNDGLPLVSIVTPSCNQAEFLEVAIRSVHRQDYPRIEHLVIDGGSTDGSIEIIKKYEDRIAYWTSEPDSGQANAINKGLREASGEFVAWLNSDDAYLPGAVNAAVTILQSRPELGMIYADGIMVDSELRVLDYHTYRTLSPLELLSFDVILQPATFMRKSALESVGYLNEDYQYILDHDLWLRIANEFPILHTAQFWALERTHSEAKTIAHAAAFVEEAERLIAWAESEVRFKSLVARHSDRIVAGLKVFSARRLIDAGKYWAALQHLARASTLHPKTVWRYWYKVVQAGLSAIGLSFIFEWYRNIRRRILHRGRQIRINEDAVVSESG